MLSFLTCLLEVSLGCSAVFLVLLTLTPCLAKRFSPHLRYWAWGLLAVHLVLPGAAWGAGLCPPLIRVGLPEALVQSEYYPAHAYASDQKQHYYPNVVETSGPSSLFRDGDRYHLSVIDHNGNELEIRNNRFSRTVTIDGVLVQQNHHWPTYLFYSWLIIASVCLLGTIGRYLLFRRRALRWSAPASLDEVSILNTQRDALGVHTSVRLLRCSLVRTPLLMGFFRPVILLPEDISPHAIPFALSHELTHWKRGDLWYQLLMGLARCVHWFNPLVWAMERQARRDMELCCDHDLLKDRNVQERQAYGRAILEQMTARDRISHLTTGFSGDKKSVFARFHAIMHPMPKKSGFFVLLGVLCAAMLAVRLVDVSGSAPGAPVEVSLGSRPERAISALYHPDSIALNELPSLTVYTPQDTLIIQPPDDTARSLRVVTTYYLGGTVHSRFHSLSPDLFGQFSIPIDLEGYDFLAVTLSDSPDSPNQYSFTVSFPAASAWLLSQPEQTISAAYYPDGFDWDYSALPSLTIPGERDELVLQLPEDVTEPVGISIDHTVISPHGSGQIYKDTQYLTPGPLGQIILPVSRAHPDSKSEDMNIFLRWGEDSVFNVMLHLDFADLP